MTKPDRWSIGLNVVGLLVSLLFPIAYIVSPSWLTDLTREDGWIESLSAIFYLLASIFCFGGIRKYHSPRKFWIFWCLLFGALFLAIAGEEISWGQRLFNIAPPPELEAINVQQELNLHNIDGIHQHIRLFALIFVAIFGCLMPIFDRYSRSFHLFSQKLALPIYPLKYITFLAIAIAFMMFPRAIVGKTYFEMDEVGEFYFSLSWFLFALSNFSTQPIVKNRSSQLNQLPLASLSREKK